MSFPLWCETREKREIKERVGETVRKEKRDKEGKRRVWEREEGDKERE